MTGDPVGDRGVLTFDPSGGLPPLAAPVAPTPVPPAAVEAPVAPTGLVAFTGGKDKVLRIVDLHDGQAKPAAPAFGGEVLSVALSADEKRLLVGAADKSVSVFDGGTAEPTGKLEGAAGAVQRARDLARRGDRLRGRQGFCVSVFGLTPAGASDGKPAAKLEGHTGGVNALALSTDGRGCSRARATARSASGTRRRRRNSSRFPAIRARSSPSRSRRTGRRSYVGGRDPSIRVYDAAAGGPLATWPSPVPVVEALIASPDGSLLYVIGGGGKEVHALGTADGQPTIAYTGSPSPLTCATISADGEWIAAGAEDGRLLRTWKKGRAAVVWTSPKLHEGAIRCVTLTPDVAAKPGAPADGTPPAPAAPGMDVPAPAPGMDAPSAPGMDAPPLAPGMNGTPPAPGMDAPAPGMDAPTPAPGMDAKPAPAPAPAPAVPLKPSEPAMK